jgi:hypothetical protein
VAACVQFFVDAVELGGEGAPDVCVFGVEGLLEGLFGVPERLRLPLVCLYIGGEVVELFLIAESSTSTVDSLFFKDITYIYK